MIENIHTIIAAAAVKFSFDQLTHLFVLIQKVSAAENIEEWFDFSFNLLVVEVFRSFFSQL